MYLTISIILLLSLFVVGPSSSALASRLNVTAPILGAAASYSVLAGLTVENYGPTTVQGDLGVHPGSGQPSNVFGFPPGTVAPPWMIHDADSDAFAAQTANLAAYDQLSNQSCDVDYGSFQELSGLTLWPGVYCANDFQLSGPLTLTGSGVWIFKSETLTIRDKASVDSKDPCNIWWRVGGKATLETKSSLYGNILAVEDIELQNGAMLNGRALSLKGRVKLNSNKILGSVCMEQPTPTLTATATEEVPTPTGTYIPPTATAEVPTATNMPVMTALPPTGGAPLQSESAPWGLVIIAGFSALALVFGLRAYRKTSKRSQ